MDEASGSGHWYGLGRYERGDRRDQRLVHWYYGQRMDGADHNAPPVTET